MFKTDNISLVSEGGEGGLLLCCHSTYTEWLNPSLVKEGTPFLTRECLVENKNISGVTLSVLTSLIIM
jgi:hypothetical protein